MVEQVEGVKNYIGIDISKKRLDLARLFNDGKIERYSTGTNKEGIGRLIKFLKKNDVVVLEAGSQAFRIAKRIKHAGIDVIVLNPGDVATIYSSLKKTDNELRYSQ